VHIRILGTRGVPSQHGGFETFAHDLSLFLTAHNHEVTVYCQRESGIRVTEDMWEGVRRVHIPAGAGALGTMQFDWASVRHACTEKGVALTLGYNTGIFNYLLRWHKIPTVMNMDGIEWKRAKWSAAHRAWLWLNELAGAKASDHLVADHPEISLHLQRHSSPSKISVIPYGAHALMSASTRPLERFGVDSKNYYLLIARPEPENSIIEIVRGFSRKRRREQLVVLGDYSPSIQYQRHVIEVASPNVKFVGAVYDREIVKSLRYHAKAYIHGHRVGGTNPSLVEALAAGNAVIAHDNRFTRWVAGDRARYFDGSEQLAEILDSIEADPIPLRAMEQASRVRHLQLFEQERVLAAYEELLLKVSKSALRDDVSATLSEGGIDGVGTLNAHQWASSRMLDGGVVRGGHQRRAAVRQTHRFPVIFHWNDGVDKSETGFTYDVATNGVLILSNKLPPVNCTVRVEMFTYPSDLSGEKMRIECFGKVTRVVEHSEGSGFGVQGAFDYEHLGQKAFA